MTKSFEERIRYAKILLGELRKGPLRWSQLSSIVTAHCGTPQKFVSLMRWLINEEYIIKMGPPRSRTPYRLNPEKVQFNDEDHVIMKLS